MCGFRLATIFIVGKLCLQPARVQLTLALLRSEQQFTINIWCDILLNLNPLCAIIMLLGFERYSMKKRLNSQRMFAIVFTIATFLLFALAVALTLVFTISDNRQFDFDSKSEPTLENFDHCFKVLKGTDKIPLTIEIDDHESQYGDPLATLTCRVVSGELLSGDEISDVVRLIFDGSTQFVGTYDIDFECINDAYDVTCTALGTYTLLPRSISVQVNDAESLYGEVDAPLSATLTAGSLVGDDTLASIMSFERAEGRNAGAYVIRGGCLDMNYSATITNGTYTVTPRPITVSVADASSAYKQPIVSNAIELTDGSLVYHDTLDGIINLTTPSSVSAGVYEIVGSSNPNYDVTFVYTHGPHSVYEITPIDAAANMTFNLQEGASVVQGTRVSCTVQDLYLPTALTYELNGEIVQSTSGVGDYTVTATIDDVNYFGTKVLHFSTFASVSPKMTALSALLDTYHSATATDKAKIDALFDAQAIYANLLDTDYKQIESSSAYTALVQNFVEDWNALRQTSNTDMAVATKAYDNVLTAIIAAVSAASILAFMAIKALI